MTRPLTIFAQDPSVKDSEGNPLITSIDVPAEQLAPGPCGYRIRVVDYDSSTRTLYRPVQEPAFGHYVDQFEGADPEQLLNNPMFHQQNVYAIAMRVLGRFEYALGRRVSWNFRSHQLKIVPHAFREANAFYSRDEESLLFGYFTRQNQPKEGKEKLPDRVYTCLSHDIVAHETGHALLDGVRPFFLKPSMPDQAAFHEGFSDIIAILSVTSVTDLVEALLTTDCADGHCDNVALRGEIANDAIVVHEAQIKETSLNSLTKKLGPAFPLLSLAREMGSELTGIRGASLRESLAIKPDRSLLNSHKFQQAHRRGELLVAAVLRAVLHITRNRCLRIGIRPQNKPSQDKKLNKGDRIVSRRQLAECFAKASKNMLTICIRALDYIAPVHLTFQDYLAGLLTADYELVGNDLKFGYRRDIIEAFAAYGIGSSSNHQEGFWIPPQEAQQLRLERTDHEAMMTNGDEMFRFIWENRDALGISDDYYTLVQSVAPTVRVGPDGSLLSETIVQYIQSAEYRGRDLAKDGYRLPKEMRINSSVSLYGGGTLIFDVRGKLKYHIYNRLDNRERQNERLAYCWSNGIFRNGARMRTMSISNFHEDRMYGHDNDSIAEEWR